MLTKDITFATNDFIVRPLQPEDEQLYTELVTCPDSMKLISKPVKAQVAHDNFLKALAMNEEQPINTLFIAIKTIQDEPFGLFSLIPDAKSSNVVDLGMMVCEAFRQKKMAAIPYRGMIDYLFFQSGVEKIVGRIDPDNFACQGLVKKLGYQLEAKLPENTLRKWLHCELLKQNWLPENSRKSIQVSE